MIFQVPVNDDLTFYFKRNPNHNTATYTGFGNQLAEQNNVVCWFYDVQDDIDLSCKAFYSLYGTGTD